MAIVAMVEETGIMAMVEAGSKRALDVAVPMEEVISSLPSSNLASPFCNVILKIHEYMYPYVHLHEYIYLKGALQLSS